MTIQTVGTSTSFDPSRIVERMAKAADSESHVTADAHVKTSEPPAIVVELHRPVDPKDLNWDTTVSAFEELAYATTHPHAPKDEQPETRSVDVYA